MCMLTHAHSGGDALVTSGIMESLLLVLEWKAYEPMNITVSQVIWCPSPCCDPSHPPQLVTRAVRVIDLITGLDMSAFHSHGGWNKMLDRLQQEVAYCAEQAPGILPSQLQPVTPSSAPPAQSDSEEAPMETSTEGLDETLRAEGERQEEETGAAGSGKEGSLMCMPERAALIKSILNFLKKAIPEPTFAENIRTCRCYLFVCMCHRCMFMHAHMQLWTLLCRHLSST